MRHYTALQHGPDGPWHYVSASAKGAHPVGYCTVDCTHETAAEAFEHFRQYLLDTAHYDGKQDDAMRRCEVCKTWTQGVVTYDLGWHSHHLCSIHANRETLESIALPSGIHLDSWRS